MRTLIVLALAIIAIVLIASPASALVTVPGESKRNSFGSVWDAVIDLQKQILELKATVLDLQRTPGPEGEKGDKGDPGFCSTDSAEYRALQERIVVLEQLAGVECISGETRDCYTGSPETEGVGVCHKGTQTCVNSKWATCNGQVLPAATDVCDGRDDDCDGTTDDGSLCVVANGEATCSAGACGSLVCNAGYADCDGNVANGCEASLTTSNNCGACGNACESASGANAACVAGTCTYACMNGFGNCDFSSDHTCETDTQKDASNCGFCGRQCDLPNALSSCSDGSCRINRCTSPGFLDCDGSPSNGCEANILSGTTSCGACGHVCPLIANGAPMCNNGACGAACNAGYGNCDMNLANGCEASLSSVNACGACGKVCPPWPNGTADCTMGLCGGHCNAGFANCDGQSSNGCEVNMQSNVNNCGGCGIACSLGGTCASGACTYATSCMALHQANPGLPTGSYRLNIGGVEQTVCCDMTTNGGGYPCST